MDSSKIDEYLSNINVPKLKTVSSDLCEGYLTLNECYNSLKDMKLKDTYKK